MSFYLVMFYLIAGEPVIVKEPKQFSSMDECAAYGNSVIQYSEEILKGTPESYVRGVCIKREFSKVADPL